MGLCRTGLFPCLSFAFVSPWQEPVRMVILKQIEEVQAIGTLAHTPVFWQRIGVFVNSPICNPASCRLQCVRYCVSPDRCHHGPTGLIVQPFLLVFGKA